MKHRIINIAGWACLIISIAVLGLWVRTEAIGLTDTVWWSGGGEYRCIEFSSDDMEFKILADPGILPAPLKWQTTRGWIRPPAPSNLAALPKTSVTWVIPQPRSQFHDVETKSLWLPRLGFDYAEFAGWYGPGTIVYSYRISYFVLLLPAAAVSLSWIGLMARRRYLHRHRAGFCAKCGYDLRASPDRCPECGTTIDAPR